MRRLGIIGGMSAESTAHYYAMINRMVRARLGGLSSAELLLWSVDFAEIAALQERGDWAEAGRRLAGVAAALERAGAEAILLATNTMHKVAPAIETAITVPFLHIADATGVAVRGAGFTRPGLIATAYTMEQDFYAGRLAQRHGIAAVIPGPEDRAMIHAAIFEELCRGVVTDASRARFIEVAHRLADQGADCLILGCTEVGMLIGAGDVPLPVFDTTEIHAAAAVDFALSPLTALAAE